MKREDPAAVTELAAARLKKRKPRVAYEESVIESATLFTVVHFSPRGGTDRHELSTLREAVALAEELLPTYRDGRDVMVYAVDGMRQALVKTLTASGVWKEPKR